MEKGKKERNKQRNKEKGRKRNKNTFLKCAVQNLTTGLQICIFFLESVDYRATYAISGRQSIL
jgi:hypothetical protein